MTLKDSILKLFGREANSDVECTGMSDAARPRTISFLDNSKFAEYINKNDNIAAVFVRKKTKGMPSPATLPWNIANA